MAGKYTRARAPLAQTYTNPISTQSSSAHGVENDTNRIFESKDDTTSMKIVNYIERHNFCCNDLLTKSNRTEIQTCEVEERTFGKSKRKLSTYMRRTRNNNLEMRIAGLLLSPAIIITEAVRP